MKEDLWISCGIFGNGLVFHQNQTSLICLCCLWKGFYKGTTKWLRCQGEFSF